jgi:predicted Zn-dependent peptidase
MPGIAFEGDRVTESIFSHVFPNGLALVAEPMAWLESAAFRLLVPAGGVYDPPRQGGLAGFICEMTLRGAGSRDSHDFMSELDNLGLERSESVTDSHTGYGGATLADNLLPALAVYADVLRNPLLPAEQLEAGRQVLLQELRAIDDEPSHKVMLELRRRHYPDPWGRPCQGDRQAIEAITIDHVRNQFRQTYRPNGTILGVAGRFDWEKLKDTVGELLGDWHTGSEIPVVESNGGLKNDHLTYDSNQTQIGISYSSVPYRDPDYFQAWGGVGVLSGGMSSRLFTEVRERRGLCYSVYATYHTLLDRGGVFCYAGTSADRAQETLDVTVAELVRLGHGVEENELGRLKARIKSALIMQQESSSARAGSVARDWYHLGRARTLGEIDAIVNDLTCESINNYLAEHPPGEFTVVTLGPSELEAPVGVS